MSNIFNEGKAAAEARLAHDANPYNLGSDAYEQWAKGWLVGDDPVVWGHLTPTLFVATDDTLVESLEQVYELDPQETEWESGRKASQAGGCMSDNPYEPETVSKDEWDRGFVHGSQHPEMAAIESDLAALPSVQVLPSRTFWAHLNNLQIRLVLSVSELAKHIGLAEEMIVAEMVRYGFYDDDGIPLYEVAAA
jgi:hypothetical protein